ncbi:MAG: amidohydrolase family protein [Chloroflexota bacterium]|nr:amidohydrolase family protein [Chloroflexota bacterium]
MPFGGNEWLSLTEESTIEPDLLICDPHHHFWDMRPARIPYQRYLLDELLSDTNTGHNITSTVFIETRSMYRATGPEELKPVGEVEFAQGIAAASSSGNYGDTKVAAAIIGHANLHLGSSVKPVLEQLQAASPKRFRGIRHPVTWDPHPEISNTAAHKAAGQLASPAFRSGAKVLSDMGMSFDAWLYFPQLTELAAFAKALPDLTIILNHIGGLLRTGPYANKDAEVLKLWKHGISQVAECPNVVVKLGGITQPRTGYDWHLRKMPIGSEELSQVMAPLMDYCIEKFGPDRCMFESNFPPDKVGCSYNVMFNAFKRLSSGYSDSERTSMFHDTATKIYKIEE